MRISVVIPSLLRGSLEAAVQSVRAQTIASKTSFEIIVGVDAGAEVPDGLAANSEYDFRKVRAGHKPPRSMSQRGR